MATQYRWFVNQQSDGPPAVPQVVEVQSEHKDPTLLTSMNPKTTAHDAVKVDNALKTSQTPAGSLGDSSIAVNTATGQAALATAATPLVVKTDIAKAANPSTPAQTSSKPVTTAIADSGTKSVSIAPVHSSSASPRSNSTAPFTTAPNLAKPVVTNAPAIAQSSAPIRHFQATYTPSTLPTNVMSNFQKLVSQTGSVPSAELQKAMASNTYVRTTPGQVSAHSTFGSNSTSKSLVSKQNSPAPSQVKSPYNVTRPVQSAAGGASVTSVSPASNLPTPTAPHIKPGTAPAQPTAARPVGSARPAGVGPASAMPSIQANPVAISQIATNSNPPPVRMPNYTGPSSAHIQRTAPPQQGATNVNLTTQYARPQIAQATSLPAQVPTVTAVVKPEVSNHTVQDSQEPMHLDGMSKEAEEAENERMRLENRERKKRWREANEDRNKDNDLRCRVNKRAHKLYGKEPSKAKEMWIEEEFNKRKSKRQEKEGKGPDGNLLIEGTDLSSLNHYEMNSVILTTLSEFATNPAAPPLKDNADLNAMLQKLRNDPATIKAMFSGKPPANNPNYQGPALTTQNMDQMDIDEDMANLHAPSSAPDDEDEDNQSLHGSLANGDFDLSAITGDLANSTDRSGKVDCTDSSTTAGGSIQASSRRFSVNSNGFDSQHQHHTYGIGSAFDPQVALALSSELFRLISMPPEKKDSPAVVPQAQVSKAPPQSTTPTPAVPASMPASQQVKPLSTMPTQQPPAVTIKQEISA